MKSSFKTAMLVTALAFGSASLAGCADNGLLGGLGATEEPMGFNELDANNDDFLTENEFDVGYDDEEFSAYDQDDNGLLDEDEFLSAGLV